NIIRPFGKETRDIAKDKQNNELIRRSEFFFDIKFEEYEIDALLRYYSNTGVRAILIKEEQIALKSIETFSVAYETISHEMEEKTFSKGGCNEVLKNAKF
ncbi:hypothetical protein, partial [Parasediminibacterium sp. JCM 36343]|uniref:hypothetical protein n=1 Tax=Parasediminibacterium sp. JCM 36343 TaxID=3374279 RepID=UPI00397840FC